MKLLKSQKEQYKRLELLNHRLIKAYHENRRSDYEDVINDYRKELSDDKGTILTNDNPVNS